jgi:hypothetical protein
MNIPLKKFLDFVASDFSLDYWADEAIDEAVSLANNLSLDDFNELSSCWLNFDIVTKVRIAEILSEVELFLEYRIKILMHMLESDQEDIVEASMDSINSIIQMNENFSSELKNEILAKIGLMKENIKSGTLMEKITDNVISLLS